MKGYTELLMVLATAAVLILLIAYDKWNEGFANQPTNTAGSPSPPVTSCPDLSPLIKTHAYYEKDNQMCCDSPIKNGKCDGKPVCSLKGPSGDVKSCTELMALVMNDDIKTRILQCPAKLPNAFWNGATGEIGCTDSPVKPNYKGPIRASAKKCNAYISADKEGKADFKNSVELSSTQEDGCMFQSNVESLQAQCMGQDCMPFARKIPSQNVSLSGLEFTDVDNVRRTCYDRGSYATYLTKLNPKMDIYTAFRGPPYIEQLCSNAKDLYIDKKK